MVLRGMGRIGLVELAAAESGGGPGHAQKRARNRGLDISRAGPYNHF
jgi:hypothetical protein